MNAIVVIMIIAAPSPFLREKPNCPINSCKTVERQLEDRIIKQHSFRYKIEGEVGTYCINLSKDHTYECGAWEGIWFIRGDNLVIVCSYSRGESGASSHIHETIFIKIINHDMLWGCGFIVGNKVWNIRFMPLVDYYG
jgi:hypothetical protein